MRATQYVGVLATAVALTFAATAPAAAQQQGQPSDSVQMLMVEYQQIRQRLAEVEQQAFEQKPELEELRADVQETVEAAMHEENPQLETHLDRMEELESEFEAAQQAQDQERTQEIMEEAQAIQAEIQQTQQQAMERDDVAAEFEQFEDRLIAAMTEIEPETEQMLSRIEEIAAALGAS